MYRSWLALVAAGVLGGLAVVTLFAGFGAPFLLPVAAVLGLGALAAYRYASTRMVESVYAEVGTSGLTDGGGRDPDGGRTSEAVDSAAAASDPGEGEYDEWTWADVAADDPFWSADTDDWEDPWETNTTDPGDAAGSGSWRDRRGSGGPREQGRWWDGAGSSGSGTSGAGSTGRGASGDRAEPTADERLREAYEILGVDPGAGPETVRDAYRERVKRAHPDTEGGSAEEFIRVREAYEYLRERLSGGAGGPDTGDDGAGRGGATDGRA